MSVLSNNRIFESGSKVEVYFSQFQRLAGRAKIKVLEPGLLREPSSCVLTWRKLARSSVKHCFMRAKVLFLREKHSWPKAPPLNTRTLANICTLEMKHSHHSRPGG